ncbi:two-component system, LuxR family, sensor kinase FixL [Solimonas aquatica]|uniref:Sensor protein FixL n=1 Tax=Solimonas aquatica TaxID=489703 RepID=A0A1H8ZNE2_9GAMM|nr:PAS domain-containing sensor histidine kinase [Solimonas aquatica]SEP65733.1 two-component system, LuxR family, sensor kinase FixL [Solimonas aquatica]
MSNADTLSIAGDPLRALLDAAVDAIILIDTRGRIIRFSNSAERLFGYRAEEVQGQNIGMLMPAPDANRHDAYMERYASTGERRIIGIGREVQARDRAGRVFPVDLSVGEYVSGNVHGFVGIIRDISERKRHEAQLRQNTEELRLIFEYAPTAMLITDLRGMILRANRACAELFGYQIAAMLGGAHQSLVFAEDRENAAELLADLLEQSGECRCELRYCRRDGSVMHTMLYSAVATDAQGQQQFVISEIVDRTALLAANREAETLRARLTHATRVGQLGEMVSGIAHEVNQPLTAIANYASACRRLLQSGRATPEDLVAPMDKIAAQAERAGQVIRGLRNLARRQDGQRTQLDLNALVGEIMPLVEFESRQAGILLRTHLHQALPPVSADGVQIQQVVLNLIRNALEAMSEQRHGEVIDIETDIPEPGYVEVRVSDRGPGISPQAASRLFEPFYTTKQQGMGLGLSICQSIAHAHGGLLSYYRNEFRGATFALRLPQAEPNKGNG